MSQAYSITVFVGPDGRLKFLYDDELQPLLKLGTATVQRASHVEPVPGGWAADLGPSRGPVLGPFPLRSEALAAESEWLARQMAHSTEDIL